MAKNILKWGLQPEKSVNQVAKVYFDVSIVKLKSKASQKPITKEEKIRWSK